MDFRRPSITPFATVTVIESCALSLCVSDIVKAHVPAPCGVTVNVAPLAAIVAIPPQELAVDENVPV